MTLLSRCVDNKHTDSVLQEIVLVLMIRYADSLDVFVHLNTPQNYVSIGILYYT